MKLLSNLKSNLHIAFVAALFSLPLTTKADFLIQGTTTSSASALDFSSTTAGYSFTTGNTPLTVYALGTLDNIRDNGTSAFYNTGTGTGSNPASTVGLWTSSGVLLASVTINGTETLYGTGTLQQRALNGFRYESLSTPLSLSLNTTYVIGTFGGFSYSSIPLNKITTSPSVTLVSGAPVDTDPTTTSLTFPADKTSYANYSQIVNSNASFSPLPAPEPGNFVALAMAGTLTVMITKRRRKVVA